jgi:hypothetical protein
MAKKNRDEEKAGLSQVVSFRVPPDLVRSVEKIIDTKMNWWQVKSDFYRDGIVLLVKKWEVENPGTLPSGTVDALHAAIEHAYQVLYDLQFTRALTTIEQSVLKDMLPAGEYDDAWRVTLRHERIIQSMIGPGSRRKKYQQRIDFLKIAIGTYDTDGEHKPDQKMMSGRPSEAQEVE